MPYGLPGLRVIVAVLWLTTLDAVVFLAIDFEVPEPLMVAILAPQLPLAYLAARYAVAPGPSRRRPRLAGSVLAARPDRRCPSAPARTLSLARPRPGVVRVAAARPVAAGLGGHPAAVRAGLFLFVVRHEPPVLTIDRAPRRAAHAALHGRLRRGDGRAVEPGRAQRLRPDAVRGDAAVDAAPRSSPPS